MSTIRIALAFMLSLLVHVQETAAQEVTVDTITGINQEYQPADTASEDARRLPRRWFMIQDLPLDSMFLRRQNTRFGRGLYQLLIRSNNGKLIRSKTPVGYSDLMARDGMIIRKIEFRKMDIFAPGVSDTAYRSDSGLERFLNGLHNDTRKNLLKRYLLLKPGDPLDVFVAAENERILRDLYYINDAKFLVKSIPGSPDSIDLVLLTQDLFPIGFEAEITRSNAGAASLWNQNMLGYGLESLVTLYWDGEEKPVVGYGLSAGFENLVGSFVNAKLQYTDRWNLNSILAEASRNFKTASFRFAGGAMVENATAIRNIELLDTTLSRVQLKYTNTDFWFGRMFRIRRHPLQSSSGFHLTGRVNFYKNHEGPQTSENFLYPFQDKTLLLFSTGYSQRGFKKDNMIHTFGRTEDVPFGYKLELVSGVEYGQYNKRPYFAINVAASRYKERTGYLYALLQFGTFLNRGYAEQGVLKMDLEYFTRLYRYKRFQYRNFINLSYLNGINRFSGEFLSLENRDGIRGLRSDALRGTDKLYIGLESVIFSPYRLLGFRFAFFGSVDLGMISDDNQLFSDPRFYSGIRAGIRIRNDQLVFNTLEISLAFYPGIPADGRANYVSIGSLPRLRFDDLYPVKPTIVDYR